MKTLFNWLAGMDGCRLPCWAGITPGETSWAIAEQLIESISGVAKVETFRDEICTFGECNEIRWSLNNPIVGNGYVYSKLPKNKIHSIQIEVGTLELLKALDLKNILEQYGKPAILLFSTDPDQPGQKFLELILVYPERQFAIKYSKYAELSGSKMVSCGKDSNIDLIILNNKEQLMSLDSIASAVETRNLYVDVWHKSVEEASGMTIAEFYETFKKAGAPCITTPVEIWVP